MISLFLPPSSRGMKARAALMAVMRKMLSVAYQLLKTEQRYDPTKVYPQPVDTPSSAKLVAVRACQFLWLLSIFGV